MDRLLKRIISGGLVLSLGATGYGGGGLGGYYNRTGSWGLSREGYRFNPPSFTNHNSLTHQCSRNLFKDAGTEDQKVFSCVVMRLEQSTDKQRVRFNSEVAIRVGKKGGIISTLLDNSGDEVRFNHLLTHLEGKDKLWTKVTYVIEEGASLMSIPKRLIIKSPKNNSEIGFDGKIKLQDGEATYDPVLTKEYSGAGMENTNGKDEGALKNIEMLIEEQDYEGLFKKLQEEDLNESDTDEYYFNNTLQMSDDQRNKSDDGTKAFDTANNEDTGRGDGGVNIKDKVEELLKSIQHKKGDGVELDEICSFGEKRQLKTEQKEMLKEFCAVKEPKK